MPHLNKIVKAINDHLKAGALKSESFQGGKFYGLAKKVMRIGENLSAVPTVMASDGIGTDVTPDETYPFSIYHRCLNGAFVDDYTTGFGDGHGIKESNQMVAIVYADPQKVDISQEDLAFLIASGLPTAKIEITDTVHNKRSSALITPLGFNNDSYNVYTGEYQGVYALQPQSIYFSLSYKIEITADRDCVICS